MSGVRLLDTRTQKDLRKYVNDIDLMFDKLSKKYYV